MWIPDYISAVKRKMRDQYRFTPRQGSNEYNPKFDNLPDGEYQMTIIKGMPDRVQVINGEIYCCNFDENK